MPRPLRDLVTGEIYHLTARGTERREIFIDDVDRQSFISRLARVAHRRPVSWLGYCLMGNHIHVVVRGDADSVSHGMRDLLGGHGQYFNHRHDRTGHLFGGRFHHVHVTSDQQLHATLRYVALNPVAAGLTGSPEAWPWSSYASMARGTVTPGSVDLEALAPLIGARTPTATSVYARLYAVTQPGIEAARRSAVASAVA